MRRSLISVSLAGLMLLILPATALAANPATDPNLGTAGNYGVLAGTTITASGLPSWVTGRMGVSPGLIPAITGFPPSTSGPLDAGATSPAGPAQAANTAAFGRLGTPPQLAPTAVGPDLAGLTLTPGVYSVTAFASNLTGKLILNGSGVYVFQMSSTLITSSGSVVELIGGAQPCQVFWRVPSSATIGATTAMVGNILALTDISLLARATLNGRALAQTGQVTLINNRIIQAAGCGFSAPTYVAPPVGNTLPATLAPSSPIIGLPALGVPIELLRTFPWLLLIGLGSGAAALALGFGSRRRRRTS